MGKKRKGRIKSLKTAIHLAIMYLESGFISCPRCGEEVSTAKTDAEYELNKALEDDE